MRHATRHENVTLANRRPLAALFAILAVLIGFVGLAAIVVVGLESFGHWIGTYLIPVVVIVGVVIAALALLVWAVKRLPNPPSRDRLQ